MQPENRKNLPLQHDTYQKVRDICFVASDINSYLTDLLGEKFRQYRQRWYNAEKHQQAEAFPLFLVLETMNACNLKCEMCFRREQQQQQHVKLMSYELITSIMQEAARYNCPSIAMNGNNEPLLDKRLPELISLAGQSGCIDSRINTNGLLLTPEISESLIRSGLTRLSVSLDAVYPETYARLRHGSNFSRVLANIREFLAIRERCGAKLPVLRCTFVVTPENEGEIAEFEDFWRDSADYVSFQRYVPHTGHERAIALATHLHQHQDLTCSQPFERLIINVDGDVFPCCSPQGLQLKLGNIGAASLQSIWSGTKEAYLRNSMVNNSWREIPSCRLCLTGCQQ